MKLYNTFLELAFLKITSEDLARRCEKVSNDLAVSFAEWCFDNKTVDYFEEYTKSELLDIYNQECEDMLKRKFK